MARTRSFSPAAVACALAAAVYLALWCGIAWRVSQRGTLGADVDRRGPQVLTAVSMLDTAAALVAMPLLALACDRRAPGAVAGGLFAATTALVVVVAGASDRVSVGDAAAARVLLLATAAAAFGLAQLAGALCRDVFDAAGLVYGGLLVASGGVVFAAPLLARVPEAGSLIPPLLLVNPFVATASATAFDLLRTDVLYRATPIGQRLFDYPAWYTAAAAYTAAAGACGAATAYVIPSREARCV